LNPNAKSALQSLAIQQVLIPGGIQAVTAETENQIKSANNPAIQTSRFSGAGREETSRLIAEYELAKLGFVNTHVNLARGDQFPDALSGGPHAGTDKAPIVLASSPSLLSPAADQGAAKYATDHKNTLSTCDIFGGNEAINPTVEAQFEQAGGAGAGRATVTVGQSTTQAGGTITGTITGQNIQSVTVSGCGLTNQPVTRDASGNFSLTIPPSQQPGQCTLTFTTTFTDNTTESDTVNITVSNTGSATSTNTRPELVSAAIVRTVTTLQATASDPVGTTVRYVFDEPVPGLGAFAATFHVYNYGNSTTEADPAGAASAVVDPSNNNAVLVRFANLNNDPGMPANSTANLTLATVDLDAVADQQGQTNPEGDAAIGTATSGGVTAGKTSAPDLISVGRFGGTPNTNEAAVDFTFDQTAFVQDAGGAGFHLILTDGTDVTCTPPANNSNNTTFPGGGNAAGGNGTTTITVTCGPVDATNSVRDPGGGAGELPVAAPANSAFFGQAPSATNTARGIVLAGAVGTADPNTAANPCTSGVPGPITAQTATNICNPLEASNTPHAPSSTPDLTQVSLQPATNTTSPDVAVFTFDESIQTGGTAVGNNFFVYHTNGTETAGGTNAPAAGTNCTGAAPACPQPTISGNQVAVSFPNGTLADVVGGNVRDGAVFAAAGSNRPNEEDEFGATNTTVSSITPGKTVGPDLISVAIVQTKNTFGTLTAASAVYTFDRAILTGSTAGNESQFLLYTSDGTRLICNGGAVVEGTGSNGLTTSQAMCTGYSYDFVTNGTGNNFLGNPESPTQNPSGVQPAQIASATLGTVDNCAVTDTSTTGFCNPEGAEATTGGTGTKTL